MASIGWKRLVRGLNLLLSVPLALLSLDCSVDTVLFQPPASSYADDEAILKVPTDDDLSISAVYLPNPDATFTLLCSHGNAEDIGQTRPMLESMQEHGYSVFAYDYRGYGTSQGRPSEEGCYKDAEAAYRYLVDELHVPSDRIIAYGRSMGGALAVYTASREPVAGLVLDSAFLSAFRVLTRLPLPGDRFPSIDRIGQIHCPVLIMHGTQDWVVPFWHGETLFRAANEPKRYLWVAGGRHNSLMSDAGEEYWQKIAELVSVIPAPVSQPAGNRASSMAE